MQLLDSFRFRPYRKIVIANLPKMRKMFRAPLLRRDLLKHLYRHRQFRAFRFADHQVYVPRHHDIIRDIAAVPDADSLQFCLEGLFRRQRIEQRHPLIATKRDEMQPALVLIADWFDMHSCRLQSARKAHPPARSAGRVGNPKLGIYETVGQPRTRIFKPRRDRLSCFADWHLRSLSDSRPSRSGSCVGRME
jgi:hypothetical protein